MDNVRSWMGICSFDVGLMNALRRALASFGNAVRMLLALGAAIAILWVIIYRLILGFTPLWLDIATMGAGGLAMIVLWVLGRRKTFDYSAPVNKPPSASPSEH